MLCLSGICCSGCPLIPIGISSFPEFRHNKSHSYISGIRGHVNDFINNMGILLLIKAVVTMTAGMR